MTIDVVLVRGRRVDGSVGSRGHDPERHGLEELTAVANSWTTFR